MDRLEQQRGTVPEPAEAAVKRPIGGALPEGLFLLIQLEPPIPVSTPKGRGYAIGWIDYSADMDLYWIVGQNDTSEVWIWPNKDIRLQENVTLGRPTRKPSIHSEETEK